MKIIILHGDDTNKSYARLEKFVDEAKRRNWEILYDDASSTLSLFGKDRLTIIRDYEIFSPKTHGTVVVYHEGILPQTFLKTLPKDAKVEEFKLPKLIWSFLEHLSPGASDRCLKEFNEIIGNDPAEFVFSVLAKHFRDLYWAKLDSASMPYPSWRSSKLKVQSSKFSLDRLKKIIDSLAKIDIEVKTGKAELVLSLDLLIAKQLE